MFLAPNDIERALQLVGELLEADDESTSIAIIGGAALALQRVVDRSTRDVDVVAVLERGKTVLARPPQPLPQPLIRAASRVARDLDLPLDWLNHGPANQWDLGLPPGFDERLHWRKYGALHVGIADRRDLIFFKLEAAADQPSAAQNRHFSDLLALGPTEEELRAAAAWVKERNVGDDYHRVVDEVVTHALRRQP